MKGLPRSSRIGSATVLLLLLLVLPFIALAQTVTGRVLEQAGLTDQNPAAFVPVTLKSETLGIKGPVSTGRWGEFYFYDVEPGDYTLEIWVSGYRTGVPATLSVSIPPNEEVELDPIVVPNIP